MAEYQTSKKIKVGVMTWNLAGLLPQEDFDISHILLPDQTDDKGQDGSEESKTQNLNEVDLFVVGMQEMVDLRVVASVIGKNDKQRALAWE